MSVAVSRGRVQHSGHVPDQTPPGGPNSGPLGVLTPVDWDAWRRDYDSMTVADQRAFYDRVFEQYPEQARFSVKALGRLLDEIDRPVNVIELGGWDGGFAAEMLALNPRILSWTNFEISKAAVEASVCADARYLGWALDEWYWELDHAADVFVASHVLEHLKLRDVRAVFDATTCGWMFLQAPLADGATNWRGYRGTHILEAGWGTLTSELDARGYDLLDHLTVPNVRCFRRRQ
jgi:methyltransferase family protein